MTIVEECRPVKRLIVKNFRPPKIPEKFEEESWTKLEEGLNRIFNGQDESVSFEILYRICEDVCRCRLAQPLYLKLYSKIELFARSFAPNIASIVGKFGMSTELLSQLVNLWNDYTSRIKLVQNIFLYLDRVFVLNRPELASIWDLSMNVFRTSAFDSENLRLKITISFLSTVQNDRENEMSVNSSTISQVISMILSLKLLEDWIIPSVAEDTQKFYDSEASRKLDEFDVPNYLKFARKRIDDESLRLSNYGLEVIIRNRLLQITREMLFVKQFDILMTEGLSKMVLENDEDALKLVFGLCVETENLDRLKFSWLEFIKMRGCQLIDSTSMKDELIIGEVIEFKELLEKITEVVFTNEKRFMEAIKDAFESFMNNRQNRPAELIAKYVDYLLRGGAGENVDEMQIKTYIEKIVDIFRFIKGKDYFGHIFQKDLARRLLSARSISMETEASFVGLLKTECGSAFTSRFEGMFKDVETSKGVATKYHHLKPPASTSRDFFATLIGSGLWPFVSSSEINLPSSIIKEQEDFAAFYRDQNKGKSLTWNTGLGYCILKANFPSGPKELQLSIYQAVVLLCFNDSSSKTYKEIQSTTGIDDATIVRVLQSLACSKVNVLVKEPKGREISVNDCFMFNDDFTSKHRRIRIIAALDQDIITEEQMLSPTDGHSDRQYQIDAAIVRLLKHHNKLQQDELIRLASEQLRFPLLEIEFNPRMESLIDREFAERDTTNPLLYKYLA